MVYRMFRARRSLQLALVPFALLALSACLPSLSVTVVAEEEASAGGIRVVQVPRDARGGLQVRTDDGRAFHVPPGHLPPPGSCRIWYPGMPPGQQPPPGDCGELAARVPPEAVLLRR